MTWTKTRRHSTRVRIGISYRGWVAPKSATHVKSRRSNATSSYRTIVPMAAPSPQLLTTTASTTPFWERHRLSGISMEENGWVCRALTEEEVANLPVTGDADE